MLNFEIITVLGLHLSGIIQNSSRGFTACRGVSIFTNATATNVAHDKDDEDEDGEMTMTMVTTTNVMMTQ